MMGRPVFSVHRKLRQKGCRKSEAGLGDKASTRLAQINIARSCPKTKKKKKNKHRIILTTDYRACKLKLCTKKNKIPKSTTYFPVSSAPIDRRTSRETKDLRF